MPELPPFPALPPQTSVAGHTPVRPYIVNGTVLPDIPYIATVPDATGGLLPAGTAFTLLFIAPSLTTRNLLADKNEVTMQFGLFDGSVITGLVLLESSLVPASSTVYPAYICRPFMAPIPGPPLGIVGAFLFEVKATLVQSLDLRRRTPAFQLM